MAFVRWRRKSNDDPEARRHWRSPTRFGRVRQYVRLEQSWRWRWLKLLPGRVWSVLSVRALAIILVALAIGAIIIDSVSSRLDAWLPNIATDALSIAVTVVIVDRIVSRQRSKEQMPRVERALRDFRDAVERFAIAVAQEYIATHGTTWESFPSHFFRPIFDHWDKGLEDADCDIYLDDLLYAAEVFVSDLEGQRPSLVFLPAAFAVEVEDCIRVTRLHINSIRSGSLRPVEQRGRSGGYLVGRVAMFVDELEKAVRHTERQASESLQHIMMCCVYVGLNELVRDDYRQLLVERRQSQLAAGSGSDAGSDHTARS